MKRKAYVRPQVTPINIVLECPVMAGSVLDQNDMIKAASQEVEEVDFSNDTSFDLNWE